MGFQIFLLLRAKRECEQVWFSRSVVKVERSKLHNGYEIATGSSPRTDVLFNRILPLKRLSVLKSPAVIFIAARGQFGNSLIRQSVNFNHLTTGILFVIVRSPLRATRMYDPLSNPLISSDIVRPLPSTKKRENVETRFP